MSPWTALRRTGSLWFLPALFAAASTIGANNLTIFTGYPTSDLAAAGLGFCFAGPVLAGYTALQFRGFAAFTRTVAVRRSGAAMVLAVFWPLLLAAPTVALLGVVAAARTYPRDLPGAGLLVVGLSTVAACAALGLQLARAFPVVLAAPLGVTTTYVWLLFTPSTGQPVLRNMNGWFPACCDPGSVPATGALLASLAVAQIVCWGTALVTAPGRWALLARPVTALAAVAIPATALVSGALVVELAVADPNLQAMEPRRTPLTCTSKAGIHLCLWPEDRGRADTLLGVITELDQRVTSWNLPGIQRVSERTTGTDVVRVAATPNLTLDDLRYSLASGYVDRAAGCAGAFGSWRDERVALLSLSLGLAADQLKNSVPPRAWEAASRQLAVARARPHEMQAWFSRGPDVVCRSVR